VHITFSAVSHPVNIVVPYQPRKRERMKPPLPAATLQHDTCDLLDLGRKYTKSNRATGGGAGHHPIGPCTMYPENAPPKPSCQETRDLEMWSRRQGFNRQKSRRHGSRTQQSRSQKSKKHKSRRQGSRKQKSRRQAATRTLQCCECALVLAKDKGLPCLSCSLCFNAVNGAKTSSRKSSPKHLNTIYTPLVCRRRKYSIHG